MSLEKTKTWESAEVLVTFQDGAKLLWNGALNVECHYKVVLPGNFSTMFETENDAVQFLIKAGYYKEVGKYPQLRKEK